MNTSKEKEDVAAERINATLRRMLNTPPKPHNDRDDKRNKQKNNKAAPKPMPPKT